MRRRVAYSGAAAVLATTAVIATIIATGSESGQLAVGSEASGRSAVTAHTVPVAARTVTCWNGRSAMPGQCGRPQGRSGLATIFPALTADCPTGPAPRRGAVEVYVCRGDGSLTRYTRWQAGYDRFAALGRIDGQSGSRWTVHGQFAGRTWTAVLDGGDVFRWSATYRADPYSVEVVATGARARAAAIAAADPAAANQVGRR